MSHDFEIGSTARISWEDFSSYLYRVAPQWNLIPMHPDPVPGNFWFRQDDINSEFSISLLHPEDTMGFLVQQAGDDLNLPIETLILIAVYSRPLERANRLTLEIACAIAEQWPVAVDEVNADDPRGYYDNEALFHRLKAGLGLFR